MTRLGQAIQAALIKIPLTEQQLADASGVNQSTINRLKNEPIDSTKLRPTPAMVGKIYLCICEYDKDMAVSILSGFMADQIERARISGCEHSHMCGVCRNWTIDPADPTIGRCAVQAHPETDIKCNCFTLTAI